METSTMEQAIGNEEATDKIYKTLETLKDDRLTIDEAYSHILEVIVLDINK